MILKVAQITDEPQRTQREIEPMGDGLVLVTVTSTRRAIHVSDLVHWYLYHGRRLPPSDGQLPLEVEFERTHGAFVELTFFIWDDSIRRVPAMTHLPAQSGTALFDLTMWSEEALRRPLPSSDQHGEVHMELAGSELVLWLSSEERPEPTEVARAVDAGSVRFILDASDCLRGFILPDFGEAEQRILCKAHVLS